LSPSSICGEVDGEGDNVILAAQDVSFRHDVLSRQIYCCGERLGVIKPPAAQATTPRRV
jgi:hypothetical protein